MIRFLDKTLQCADCHHDFIWTAGEQEFHAVMGFENDPKRCPDCRRARRFGAWKPLIQTLIRCAACGKTATVPFVPRDGRPVYCRECYDHHMASREAA